MADQLDLTILKGGHVYDPADTGVRDVAIAGGRIAGIGTLPAIDGAKILDVSGCAVVPGLIDGHAHIIGGGGGMGPASVSPEMQIGEFLREGVTTVVGLIGFDTASRTLASLLVKARALEEQGMSAYCYTGGFGFPPPSLLGDIGRDIALIDRFVGVKMAYGEPTSGRIAPEDFVTLVGTAQRGGLLAGKSGISHVHLGNTGDAIRLLTESRGWGLPAPSLVPTHVNRTMAILEASAKYTEHGGTIDVTAQEPLYYADSVAVGPAVKKLLDLGVRPDRISVSSDSGSPYVASRNEKGLPKLEIVPATGATAIAEMVGAGVSIENALLTMTVTPARKLRLSNKGRLRAGYDGDVTILDSSLKIRHVFAKGRLAVRDRELLIKGPFER